MKSKYFLSALFLLNVILFSIQFAVEGPKTVQNFKLKDYNGKEVNLSDFSNSKAIVIMFIATQCPVSNSYNNRMVKLYNDYKGKNVTFLAINSNQSESIGEIKKHSVDHGFAFPVLKDGNNIIADKFNASFTPEIFVLNNKMQIVYHGRIDDNSRDEAAVKKSDLRNALDEYLAGKEISVKETKAFGCSIDRVGK
jgi:peroxiredoxin